MANLKCKSCGLVNPINAETCKRCGSNLIAGDLDDAAQVVPEGEGKKESEPEGCWGCIQTLILIGVAGAITGFLGIYIMEWLPSGTYPTIVLILLFIPPAIVGLIVAVAVLYVINLFIPGYLTRKKDDAKKSN